MASYCKACHAKIIWTTTTIGGKAMPVDAEPTEKGNILIVNGKSVIVKEKAEGELLHVSHFATCTESARFRRAK